MRDSMQTVLGHQTGLTNNLITKTQQIDSWTILNGSVTANAVNAPDGTLTADYHKGNITNSNHRVTNPTSYTSGTLPNRAGPYVFSFFAQKNQVNPAGVVVVGGGFLVTGFDCTGDGSIQWTNNTLSTRLLNPQSFIQYWGNSWYRCEMCFQIISDTAATSVAVDLQNGTTNSFVSATTDGYYLWGAQFEPGLRASPYIAVA